MGKLKKKIIWVVLFLFSFNFISYNGAIKAEALDDINIISSPGISVDTAKEWAKSKGATETFISLADLYWKYSSSNGNVNPAVAYAQAAKETGYGKFGGVIDASYHNPCGLKTSQGGSDTDPNAHMKFKSWDEGVQAHLDHLALYAGASGYPRKTTYDPRHFSSVFGKAKTVTALGGNWAPSPTYGKEIMELYSQITVKQQSSLKKITVIDTPVNNANLSGNAVEVRGWALNPSGVSKVNIYLDGKFVKTATIGMSRQDVKVVYPEYNDSNSGYSATLDLSAISDGAKTIKVEQVGKDNSTNYTEVKVNVVKNRPIQVIDTPVNNAEISGNSLTVSGWSLNTVPISKINVYVNDKFMTTATMGISRADVKAVYPSYNNANSGYSANLDVSGISSGVKTIRVEQVANDGSTYNTETKVNIKKSNPPIQVIDTLTSGQVIDGNSLSVSGWSLNAIGVSKINIYVDDALKGTTTTNIARPDVKAVYPAYNNANSGYTANIDISNVSGGNRKIRVEQVAKDGSTYNTEVGVYVNKLAPLQVIDYPSNNSVITDKTFTVSGWSLNNSGVSKINIYVNGALKGTTTTNIARPDVKAAYPQYKNTLNSGYSAKVDISDLSAGNKILKVEQVALNGEKTVNEITINIQKAAPITVIDTPSNNTKVGLNSLTVSGWALNPSGVSKVEVYVNDKNVTTAKLGLSRPDVASVYPSYKDSNSGYTATINSDEIKPGNNTITVKQIGKDGSTNSVSTTINRIKKNPVSVLDSPSNLSLITSDSVNFSGWALNDSGVKTVNIYIDKVKVVSPAINIARADVVAVYPGYQNTNVCGFSANVNISYLSTGEHSVTLEAIGNDGSINVVNSIFYYKEKPSKLIVLDPGHNNGGDEGAFATIDGKTYSETVLNGQIALKTKTALENSGYRVVLTRDPLIEERYGLNESLSRRVQLANSLNADLFVSIHQNKYSAESANGTEVYYSTSTADSGYSQPANMSNKINTSKQLATSISQKISSNVGFRNRGAKDGNLYVCRNTKMPSVLVECGFISNRSDVSKLSDSVTQQAIANSITEGVRSVAF